MLGNPADFDELHVHHELHASACSQRSVGVFWGYFSLPAPVCDTPKSTARKFVQLSRKIRCLIRADPVGMAARSVSKVLAFGSNVGPAVGPT